MSTTSIQAQVDALISSPVAQDRTQGRQSVELETAAIVENFATTLLLNPKVALYFAHLTRNSLINLVTNEMGAVTTLAQTIEDLVNITYNITDTSSLSQAQEALLELEDRTALTSAFDRYNKAVSTFLGSTISKNVIGSSTTDMKRPAAEAQQDLPTDLATLEDAHSQTLTKLSALAVGIQNFLSVPLGFLLSSMVASRSRQDLDNIITSLENDPSGSQSRDVATRLIASRASLRMISTPPGLGDPSISTSLKLPPGFLLTGTTAVLAAQASTGAGPFVLPAGGSLWVTVDGSTESSGPVLFEGNATLVGALVSWPVMIPANTHLFLKVNSGTTRIPLNTTSAPVSFSLADVITKVNLIPGFTAREFNLGRLQISAMTPLSLSIGVGSTETMSSATSTVSVYYSNSAHELLGFTTGQVAEAGVSASSLADFISFSFGTLVQAQALTDKTVLITSATPKIGSTMSFSGTWAPILGLAGPYTTSNSLMTLAGTTPDGALPNPTALVEVGDELEAPTGTSLVSKVSAAAITLATPLPTFSGPITVNSGLYRKWTALDDDVHSFLEGHASNPLSSSLSKLDSAVAILAGSATPAQRGRANKILQDLTDWLTDLLTALTGNDSLIPDSGALHERAIAENLITTLIEKNYNQAADLLSSCKIAEFFNLDYQTMSYGGSLLKATSELARTDMQFPNRSKDEGLVVGSSAGRMNSP
jgi:hypothetical protein